MEHFTFCTQMEVRIGDINYGGHLGNDRYLAFFHEGRVRYLKQLDLSEIDIGNGIGLIMTQAHVNYKAEAFAGDRLDVRVRISQIKGSRFQMEYKMVRLSDQQTIGTGYTWLVAFNYSSRKIARLPHDFTQKVSDYERNLA